MFFIFYCYYSFVLPAIFKKRSNTLTRHVKHVGMIRSHRLSKKDEIENVIVYHQWVEYARRDAYQLRWRNINKRA